MHNEKRNVDSKPEAGSALLWSLSIGHTFTHWYPGTFYILLPVLASEFGLSYTEIGFLVSFRSMFRTVANLPSGMIVDILGNTGAVLAFSLAWAGIPYLFMSFSQSYIMLLITMAMVGIGNQLWHPAALSSLIKRYPNRKGWAIGFHALGANLGDALSPAVVGVLLTFLTWRTIVIYNVIPGLAVAVLVWLLFRADQIRNNEKQQDSPKVRLTLSEYFAGLMRLLQDWRILWPTLISGFRSMAQNGVKTFIPLFLANVMALPIALVGVYTSVIEIAGMIASPIAGTLSDRLGRKSILTYGTWGTTIALVIITFLNNPLILVIMLGFLGFFLYSLRPVLFAWALDAAPREMQGTTTSILSSFQSLASAITPLVGGWIADRWGLITVFYFLGIIILISALMVLIVPEEKSSNN